jgi:hypothetical protein
MPSPEVIAVICLLWITRRVAEVADIAGCTITMIFVVPRSRASAAFESSPCGSITRGKLLVRTIGIG